MNYITEVTDFYNSHHVYYKIMYLFYSLLFYQLFNWKYSHSAICDRKLEVIDEILFLTPAGGSRENNFSNDLGSLWRCCVEGPFQYLKPALYNIPLHLLIDVVTMQHFVRFVYTGNCNHIKLG